MLACEFAVDHSSVRKAAEQMAQLQVISTLIFNFSLAESQLKQQLPLYFVLGRRAFEQTIFKA